MRKILTSVLVFLIAFFVFPAAKASAAKVVSDDKGTFTVAKTEIINDDLFVSAQTVVIDGVVNGDVFIGAQTVRISGTVNGNVHIGAQTIDLDGIIKGNVYAGTQSIMLSGANIGGSLVVGSQNVSTDKGTIIGGSVIAGGAVVKIDSLVKRNVFAGAGSLLIGENAKIGKDLYYGAGQNQAPIASGAKIAGTIHKAETPAKTTPKLPKQVPVAFRFATSLVSYLGALIIGLIFIKLFGKQFVKATGLIKTSFWKSMGVGFLVIISVVPAIIILLITIIGIPLAGLAILILSIYIILAKIVVASVVGTWFSGKVKWNVSASLAFAIGLSIIYLFKALPFVGGLISFVILIVGLGALTLQTFSKSE